MDEIKALRAQGCRVVLVLCTGSAVALDNVIDDCDAVLVAWYGGQEMGTAVSRLLYGEADCFGCLPVSFYRSTADLPDFSDYDMQGRSYRYADRRRVEYPFGYGLRYSTYRLERTPTLDVDNFFVEGAVTLCHTEAPKAAAHRAVVQVYLKNEYNPDAPIKQLIAVQPLWFASKEKHSHFHIDLDPFWFRQYSPLTGRMEEPADGTRFTLQVGFSSDDNDLVDIPFVYHNRK